MDRNRERAELLTTIGLIIDPVLRVLREPENFEKNERTRIIARYFNEAPKLSSALKLFTIGEPGHSYASHWHRLQNHSHRIFARLTEDGPDAPLEFIEGLRGQLIDALLEIPVDVGASIHESKTPFTTSCFIRDLLMTTRVRIWWFDRYFDPEVFPQFLRNVREGAGVMLVTWPETKLSSKRDKARHAAFRAVSKLYAQERGPQGYRLVETEDFHDRWFRYDESLLVFGGSISSLGGSSSFSVSRLDSNTANFDKMESEVQGGTEIFGPGNPTHP